MSSNNSSKGAAKLASVLQNRMNNVTRKSSTVTAEMGVILAGNKLKVDSLPDFELTPDDYSVCSNVYCLQKYGCVHIDHMLQHCQYHNCEECESFPADCPKDCLKNGLHIGDRVLVIWTNDGDPIIVDKVV